MIASNIRVPGSYNEVDPSGANNRLPAYRQKLLVVAPRIKQPDAWVASHPVALGAVVRPVSTTGSRHYYICIAAGSTGATEPTWPAAGGTVTDATVKWRELIDASAIKSGFDPIRCYSPGDGARYGGSGSIAHRMVRAALRQYKYAEVYLLPVNDSQTGVCAASAISITGTAVGSGSIELRIGNDLVRYAWNDGDSNTDIALGLDAAIAQDHNLPVTPNVTTGTINLLAKNAGLPGMEIGKYDAGYAAYIPEISINGSGVSAVVSQFRGGEGNADIAEALTSVTNGEFDLIAMPYKDTASIAALKAFLSTVSDEINCRGARAWIATTATIAAATTLASINFDRIHTVFVRKCRMPSYEIAAAAAAMHASTGHPAIPLNTLKLVDCDAPAVPDRLEFSEINALLWNGVTPFNADGLGDVRCVRSITTYTNASSGSADDTFLDTTVIACLDYMRKAIKAAHQLSFSQSVLRENHVDGEPDFIVTPDDIKSFNIAKCKQLERYGVCQQVEALKNRFVSVRDPAVTGRVNSDIPVEVVQGLHVLANTIRLTTTTT